MAEEADRAAIQSQWGNTAENWALAAELDETGVLASTATWMLDAIEPRSGSRVLEVACGAGRVGLEAARLVGSSGFVLCTDFSEAMVGAVESRVERLGLENVRAEVMDAEDLDLEGEQPFDAVLCRTGYMLMSDPLRALASSREALRVGGLVALSVWGSAAQNPWLSLILNSAMEQLNAPPPEPGAPGPFSLGDRGDLRRLMESAGFVDVTLEGLQAEQRYESLDDWWEQVLKESGPLVAVLAALPAKQVAAIRASAIAGAEPYVGGDGAVALPATIIAAKGRRPGP